MAREQTSLSKVKDWMRQVWRRWGWSRVTTKSLPLEEPANCATCQLFMAGEGTASGEGEYWGRGIISRTRATTKRVRMLRWGMDVLLKLQWVDETWRQTSGGPNL